MDARMMIKQFVGEVTNRRGMSFRVFTTGAAGFYLFCQLRPDGAESGLQFPVAARDLQDNVRRALANGCGVDLRGGS